MELVGWIWIITAMQLFEHSDSAFPANGHTIKSFYQSYPGFKDIEEKVRYDPRMKTGIYDGYVCHWIGNEAYVIIDMHGHFLVKDSSQRVRTKVGKWVWKERVAKTGRLHRPSDNVFVNGDPLCVNMRVNASFNPNAYTTSIYKDGRVIVIKKYPPMERHKLKLKYWSGRTRVDEVDMKRKGPLLRNKLNIPQTVVEEDPNIKKTRFPSNPTKPPLPTKPLKGILKNKLRNDDGNDQHQFDQGNDQYQFNRETEQYQSNRRNDLKESYGYEKTSNLEPYASSNQFKKGSSSSHRQYQHSENKENNVQSLGGSSSGRDWSNVLKDINQHTGNSSHVRSRQTGGTGTNQMGNASYGYQQSQTSSEYTHKPSRQSTGVNRNSGNSGRKSSAWWFGLGSGTGGGTNQSHEQASTSGTKTTGFDQNYEQANTSSPNTTRSYQSSQKTGSAKTTRLHEDDILSGLSSGFSNSNSQDDRNICLTASQVRDKELQTVEREYRMWVRIEGLKEDFTSVAPGYQEGLISNNGLLVGYVLYTPRGKLLVSAWLNRDRMYCLVDIGVDANVYNSDGSRMFPPMKSRRSTSGRYAVVETNKDMSAISVVTKDEQHFRHPLLLRALRRIKRGDSARDLKDLEGYSHRAEGYVCITYDGYMMVIGEITKQTKFWKLPEEKANVYFNIKMIYPKKAKHDDERATTEVDIDGEGVIKIKDYESGTKRWMRKARYRT